MPYENYSVRRPRDGAHELPEMEELLAESGRKAAGGDKPHPLDSEEVKLRLAKIQDWWRDAYDLHAESRYQKTRDHDYYDGDHWEEEDKAVLEERGQKAGVYNVTKQAVDWILGTERRTRVDYRILPRGEEDAPGAEIKGKVIKYIQDTCHEPAERSDAFDDAAKSGLGWLEVGVRSDWEDEPVFIAYEDWRNMWMDPYSRRRDLSDCRFIFRVKWLDLDVAQAMFPDRADVLKASAMTSEEAMAASAITGTRNRSTSSGDGYDYEDAETRMLAGADESGVAETTRDRVRVFECWYRHPEKVQIIRGGGEINLGSLQNGLYDEQNPHQKALVEHGFATLYDAIKMCMRVMVYCEGHVLQDIRSPYRHNRFPFIPFWGYRRKRDGMSYGAIRNMRDPQDDLNKRHSKALNILATNKVIVDNNAVQDWDEFAEEVSRPDGIIKKQPNSQLELIRDNAVAEEHIRLMEQDRSYIQFTSGVSDDMMGRKTNAVSGVAIQSRQNEGLALTMQLFDNARFSVQLTGEILMSLIDQFYTARKVVRIVGPQGETDFVVINDTDPDTGMPINDITATQADFVVDSANYSRTVRQAMFESFGEMLTKLPPDVVLSLLDLWVDLSDLPGKETMVQRIRQVTGYIDTTNIESKTPEQQEEIRAALEAKEQQAQLQQYAQRLQVALVETDLEKKQAEVQKILAEIQVALENTKIKRAQTLSNITSRKGKNTMQESKRQPMSG